MSVTSIDKDTQRLTLTLTAVYDAPVERAWQLFADPRQLERWWGPPTYPATVVDHDLRVGGHVTYFMTGPEGDTPHGWWRVDEVDAPHRLVILDGFGDNPDAAVPDLPQTTMTVELTATPAGGTAMTIRSTFPSLDAMEKLVAMGMDEGIRQAAGQIDDILAAPVAGS